MIHRTLVPLVVAIAASALHAQTISVLVKDGDTPTAGPAVISIDNLAVNSTGTWMVRASLSGSISVLVKSGSPFLVEGDALAAPAGSFINAFDDMTLNNLGTSGWNFFINNPVTPAADSGIYVDSTLVILETATSTAAQFSAGTNYTGFFGTKWNDARQMLVMASVDDPLIPTTTDRALVKLQIDPSNALISEIVLMKEGDTLAGFGAETLVDFETTPHGFAMNNQGSVMWVADMTGATTDDIAIVVDGVVIAREGSPSPLSGRNYELLNGKAVDLGDGGHTAFRANLDGTTTDDEVIVRDGVIVAQEGAGLAAIGAFTFTTFGTVVRVDSAGRAFWFGDWNDPDTTRDTGLFVDGTLLVQEGVTTVGGIVISNIASVQDTFSISPDGRYLIFEGQLTGGIDAAFLVDRGGNTTSFCFGDGTGTVCPCANNGAIGRGCASSTFASGACSRAWEIRAHLRAPTRSSSARTTSPARVCSSKAPDNSAADSESHSAMDCCARVDRSCAWVSCSPAEVQRRIRVA
ncbi:MAG: hypothetical protein SGI72_05945 [Planctomycetota bacterium]|nr:hypothetical protein [Planctomycetota bacterium]